jgi:DNA mismatch repair protein MutL
MLLISAGDMIIVDQHAAHERLVLENMKAQAQNVGKLPSQKLLVPYVIELGANNVERILTATDALSSFGFSIERNGVSQILVHATPIVFGGLDLKDLLNDLCDGLDDNSGEELLLGKRDEILGNIACHASIRSGRKLNIHEMNAILREMEATPFANQCNHGRPTFVKLSAKEIGKIFERT